MSTNKQQRERGGESDEREAQPDVDPAPIDGRRTQNEALTAAAASSVFVRERSSASPDSC